MRFVSLIWLSYFLLSFGCLAQTKIVFDPTFNHKSIQLDSTYLFQNKPITITKLQFYVSQLAFLNGNEIVGRIPKKHHLVDIENPSTKTIEFAETPPLFDHISFNLGIDSITNVSGAFGGDLDPTNGLYWTWQSGYINFKLEGNSTLCPARNNLFQYHIGGYQQPYNALQKIQLAVDDSKPIVIQIPIDKLLEKIDITSSFEVMSPSEKSQIIAQTISSLFTIAE